MPITNLILELESLNIDSVEFKRFDLGCKVNCYDILDDDDYLIESLYEIIDKEGNVISYVLNKK
jgi:hypothetical protein